jgi:hypothetical protein
MSWPRLHALAVMKMFYAGPDHCGSGRLVNPVPECSAEPRDHLFDALVTAMRSDRNRALWSSPAALAGGKPACRTSRHALAISGQLTPTGVQAYDLPPRSGLRPCRTAGAPDQTMPVQLRSPRRSVAGLGHPGCAGLCHARAVRRRRAIEAGPPASVRVSSS